MANYGFIILRHVNNELTNLYWKECIKCIRKFYNNTIIIIDDNSNQYFINDDNVNLKNIFVINSDYHKRGEILPFYYYYKYKFFDKAIIIHDSVFIQEFIDFNNYNNNFLWSFKGKYLYDHKDKEQLLIKNINYSTELLELYNNSDKWIGCFGGMLVIEHTFLVKIAEKYNLFNLLNLIENRQFRCSFERILGLIFTNEFGDELLNKPHILGDILEYCEWGYNYYEYINNENKGNALPVVKVWTGR